MPTSTGEQDESPPAPGSTDEDYNDDDNNTYSYPRFHYLREGRIMVVRSSGANAEEEFVFYNNFTS
jgi:hypothetical protein